MVFGFLRLYCIALSYGLLMALNIKCQKYRCKNNVQLCKCSEHEICLNARPSLVKTDLDWLKISEFYMTEIRKFIVKSYKGLTLFA